MRKKQPLVDLLPYLIIWAFFMEKSHQNYIESNGTCKTTTEDYPRRYYHNRYETTRAPNIDVHCEDVYLIRANPINKCSYCRKMIFTNSKLSTVQTNFVQEPSTLKEIELADVGIQKLETGAFANIPNLRILNLQMNQLKKIGKGTFNSLANLVWLNLSHNVISEVEEESFHGSISIETLDLSHNRISALPQDIFVHLKLKSLNISSNLLVTLGSILCGPILDLTTLVMDNNHLDSFPDCINDSNIEVLSLNFNSITELNRTLLPPQLRTFGISNNEIQDIDENTFQALPNLQSVDISGNNLNKSQINVFKGVESLVTLKIDGNDLRIIDPTWFLSAKDLNELQIARNNITAIEKGSFKHLQNLRVLDISENSIDFIRLDTMKDLSSLMILNISHNKIEYLQSGVFNSMGNLITLDLSFNSIENLQPHVFEPLRNLHILDVRFNKIKTMDIELLIRFSPFLARLSLDGNNFSCKVLGKICSYVKNLEIHLEYGKTVSSENINGISCHENGEVETNMEGSMANVISFFQNDFKKTSFYNFFKSFNGTIPEQNLNSVLEFLHGNLSAGFSTDLDKHVKEFMKFENASLQNFLKELSVITRRLQDAETQNHSLSFNELSSSIHNEMKAFLSFENSSFTNFMNKFSEMVDKIIENQNDLKLIPERFKYQHETNAAKLVSADESKGMKEMISAMNELKFFFILCTFIALLVVVAVKIFPRIEKRYFSSNTYEHNQEMPIFS